MPCLRMDYQWVYIISKNKFLVKFSVEKKVKIMFRVLTGNSYQVLIGKPPDSLEFSF